MPMNYRAYIARDPSICGDEPVVSGTRITVRTVIALHAPMSGSF